MSGTKPGLLAAAVCLFALTAPPGRAREARADGASADAEIEKLLEPVRTKHDLPALGAALVTDKGAVAVAVVGVRKHGHPAKATLADKFHLGSDTKALTSALIGRLVEKGKLRWDTPLVKVFPELDRKGAEKVRQVTLEHLLCHQAGLPNEPKGGWWKLPRTGTLRKQREHVVRLAFAGGPAAPPGEKYQYSNVSYVVAGAMAERVTSTAWEDLMREQVFKPLGMKTAGFGPMNTPGRVDQPWQHKADGTPVGAGPFADNPPVMGPGATVHCSLLDWARFVADQLRGARGESGLLRAETYATLFSTPFKHVYTRGGWALLKGPEGRVLTHDGTNTQNYVTAWLFPDRNFAILVVTNQGGDAGEKGVADALKGLLKVGPKLVR